MRKRHECRRAGVIATALRVSHARWQGIEGVAVRVPGAGVGELEWSGQSSSGSGP